MPNVTGMSMIVSGCFSLTNEGAGQVSFQAVFVLGYENIFKFDV